MSVQGRRRTDRSCQTYDCATPGCQYPTKTKQAMYCSICGSKKSATPSDLAKLVRAAQDTEFMQAWNECVVRTRALSALAGIEGMHNVRWWR